MRKNGDPGARKPTSDGIPFGGSRDPRFSGREAGNVAGSSEVLADAGKQSRLCRVSHCKPLAPICKANASLCKPSGARNLDLGMCGARSRSYTAVPARYLCRWSSAQESGRVKAGYAAIPLTGLLSSAPRCCWRLLPSPAPPQPRPDPYHQRAVLSDPILSCPIVPFASRSASSRTVLGTSLRTHTPSSARRTSWYRRVMRYVERLSFHPWFCRISAIVVSCWLDSGPMDPRQRREEKQRRK